MPTGRCAGCGFSAPHTKVKIHVLACPVYVRLFHEDPHRCLDPLAEYERFKTSEDTPEARAVQRDLRLAARFVELSSAEARQTNRWRTPPDILAD